MRYAILIALLTIGIVSNAFALDMVADYGYVFAEGGNAEGDYVSVDTEFTDGGLTDFNAGATADAESAAAGQAGTVYTDGGYTDSWTYASDENLNEAGASTTTFDNTAGDAVEASANVDQSVNAGDGYADASQYVSVSVPDGSAESNNWAWGWTPYAEVGTQVENGLYETDQFAGTDSSSAFAEQYTVGIGENIWAGAQADEDAWGGFAYASVNAGAGAGAIDTYQNAYAEDLPYAEAYQDTYLAGLDLYTEAYSEDDTGFYSGETGVETHLFAGIASVESGAWADGSWGDSSAWEDWSQVGVLGNANTYAESFTPTSDWAAAGAGFFVGGASSYSDAYQDGTWAGAWI
jgi:hypothetical protein